MASTTTTNIIMTNMVPGGTILNPAENPTISDSLETDSSPAPSTIPTPASTIDPLPISPNSDTVLPTTTPKESAEVPGSNPAEGTNGQVDTSALQPITLPVMNSFVSTNKVVVDANIDTEMVPEFPSDAAQNPLDYIPKADPPTGGTDITSNQPIKQVQVSVQPAVLPKIVSGPTYTEPMDCQPDGLTPAAAPVTTDSPMESVATPPTPMVVEKPPESPTMIVENNDKNEEVESPLMIKDLLLLCQLFYLPSEHGQYGLELLNEFYWLKRNATAMLPMGKSINSDRNQ